MAELPSVAVQQRPWGEQTRRRAKVRVLEDMVGQIIGRFDAVDLSGEAGDDLPEFDGAGPGDEDAVLPVAYQGRGNLADVGPVVALCDSGRFDFYDQRFGAVDGKVGNAAIGVKRLIGVPPADAVEERRPASLPTRPVFDVAIDGGNRRHCAATSALAERVHEANYRLSDLASFRCHDVVTSLRDIDG